MMPQRRLVVLIVIQVEEDSVEVHNIFSLVEVSDSIEILYYVLVFNASDKLVQSNFIAQEKRSSNGLGSVFFTILSSGFSVFRTGTFKTVLIAAKIATPKFTLSILFTTLFAVSICSHLW